MTVTALSHRRVEGMRLPRGSGGAMAYSRFPTGARGSSSSRSRSYLCLALVSALVTLFFTQLDMAPPPPSQQLTATGVNSGSGEVVRSLRSSSDTAVLPPTHVAAEDLVDTSGRASVAEGPKRICLVTFEIAGPHLNGGVGTAFTNLATVLAKRGHKVTLVSSIGSWVSPLGQKSWDEWVDHFASLGVSLVTPAVNPAEPFANKIATTQAAAQSYAVYQWLKERENDYDVVHFPESAGVGFFTVLAKHQKLHFRNTVLVVQAHGPLFWTYLANFYYPTNLNFVELDYLERKSMELADVLLSPSHYMLEWLREYRWKRPASTFVVQNLLNHPDDEDGRGGASHNAQADLIEVSEVVFFGRFEQRKGILLFCDGVEALMKEEDNVFRRHGVHLTFMGRATDDSHGREILKRIEALRAVVSERSPTSKFQVINNFNTVEARAYLKAVRGRMVVVPSSVENLPYTVMESIYEGIPLIASDVGGTGELFDQTSRENLFKPDKPSLVRTLRRSLQSGIRPSKPAITNSRTIHAWDRWHQRLQAPQYAFTLPPEVKQRAFITVVMATYNRATQLTQALRSLEEQDYPADQFEVILVDDGTTDAEAIKAINGAQQTFKDRGWRIIRTNNLYLGGAKNAGAVEAKGDYVLFMEDDSVAAPNELATFEMVMGQSDADVLVCGHRAMTGEEPDANAPAYMALANAGGSWSSNTMGDSNFMVRVSIFRELGGFTPDKLLHEDWEFFNKAWLGGYRVELLPQPLFWKRGSGDVRLAELTAEGIFKSEMRAFRPFFDAFGPDFPGPSLLELKGEKIETSKQPDTIISSVSDFRAYNGYKNLFAEAKLKEGEGAEEWKRMNRVIDGTVLALDDIDYPRVDKQSVHPGPNYLVSKIWRSYLVGELSMRVEAEYTGPADDSDGVLFYVEVDGKVVSEKYDLTATNKKVYFSIKVPDVKVGTMVRLVADPKGGPGYDYLLMKFDMMMMTAAGAR